jgi:hypothetical protein
MTKFSITFGLTLFALFSGIAQALPDKMPCRVITNTPQFKEQKFDFVFADVRTDVFFTSPSNTDYKVHVALLKDTEIYADVAKKANGQFNPSLHIIAPVRDTDGVIGMIHLHLLPGLLANEEVIVECNHDEAS